MHGGIVSSALDSTMGALSFCQVGEGSRTPTVTMSVTYLRPVPLDRKNLSAPSAPPPGAP